MAVAIARRLDRISTIALDTNCFIYFFEDNQYADILQVIFDKIQSGQLRGLTSALTLTEVLTLPKRLKNYELENAYRLLLKNFPNLTLVDVNLAVADLAADLRAGYGLRTPDAIHLATAVYAGADAFLTNDKRLTQVKEIPVWILAD